MLDYYRDAMLFTEYGTFFRSSAGVGITI